MFHSAALASIHRIFRGPHQARGQAVYSSLSFGLGGTLGGLGGGVAWERFGAGWTFSAAAVCAFAGMVALAVARPRAA
jgi:PPP family 3-phenylpropionic acid transporter